ncbi:hypothetical protein AAFF_G00171680 [Aldrovandia affinis]|uniref:Uncharacterized protein n=1 Tax=Aldrovandia affinis TaxID=143900 RepID=A0AAD7WVV4_9TELE|nr:hypothetical protein AAFF_G00171680 [Aldrovandia affinis]
MDRLRDMWDRADRQFVPSEDMNVLQRLECASVGPDHTEVSELIRGDNRKLARYYIYLLFRYCVTHGLQKTQGSCKVGKYRYHILNDIPANWLLTAAWSDYPSAPLDPMPHVAQHHRAYATHAPTYPDLSQFTANQQSQQPPKPWGYSVEQHLPSSTNNITGRASSGRAINNNSLDNRFSDPRMVMALIGSRRWMTSPSR